MRGMMRTIEFIAGHPLTAGARKQALVSWLRWHLGLRITGQPMVFDYVDDSRLIGRLGVRNSSAAYWVGLVEPDWAGFVLHYLRSDDVFYDVGANIGVFTILASVVRDASCVAFEPVPESFSYLAENLRLNGSPARAVLLDRGVAREKGMLRFTSKEGATNHALAADEPSESAIELPVLTLDEVADALGSPTVLKVDVEGFEHEVLAGAGKVLEAPELNAVMLELRNHGARYGFDESKIHEQMLDLGFSPTHYDPFARRFLDWKPRSAAKLGDVLYLRDGSLAETRVRESRSFSVKGFDL